MSFGAGQTMNKSIKDNRELLGKRKSLKMLYRELDKSGKSKLFLKGLTKDPRDIRELSELLKKENRNKYIKLTFLLSAISGIVAYLIFIYVY